MKKTNKFDEDMVGITPRSSEVLSFAGGVRLGGVTLTKTQFKSLVELYEVEPEQDTLLQSGVDRNVLRHASHDGLRLLAWLAEYVPKGTDPLKFLVQLTVDVGLDVDHSDAEWAVGDEDCAEEGIGFENERRVK